MLKKRLIVQITAAMVCSTLLGSAQGHAQSIDELGDSKEVQKENIQETSEENKSNVNKDESIDKGSVANNEADNDSLEIKNDKGINEDKGSNGNEIRDEYKNTYKLKDDNTYELISYGEEKIMTNVKGIPVTSISEKAGADYYMMEIGGYDTVFPDSLKKDIENICKSKIVKFLVKNVPEGKEFNGKKDSCYAIVSDQRFFERQKSVVKNIVAPKIENMQIDWEENDSICVGTYNEESIKIGDVFEDEFKNKYTAVEVNGKEVSLELTYVGDKSTDYHVYLRDDFGYNTYKFKFISVDKALDMSKYSYIVGLDDKAEIKGYECYYFVMPENNPAKYEAKVTPIFVNTQKDYNLGYACAYMSNSHFTTSVIDINWNKKDDNPHILHPSFEFLTAPVMPKGRDLEIVAGNDTSKVKLKWDKPKDDRTPENQLKYYIYKSNINYYDKIKEWEKNATLLNENGSYDISEYEVTGLNNDNVCYLQVIVEDEDGNKSCYDAKMIGKVNDTTNKGENENQGGNENQDENKNQGDVTTSDDKNDNSTNSSNIHSSSSSSSSSHHHSSGNSSSSNKSSSSEKSLTERTTIPEQIVNSNDLKSVAELFGADISKAEKINTSGNNYVYIIKGKLNEKDVNIIKASTDNVIKLEQSKNLKPYVFVERLNSYMTVNANLVDDDLEFTVKKDKVYVVSENGLNNEIQSGWNKVNDTWCMISGDGDLIKGWYKDNDGKWYHLNDEGIMNTGWYKDSNNKWYKLNDNGSMITGWYKESDGKWYMLSANGEMMTGWNIASDGKWYYFDGSGAMVHDQYVNGYYLGSNGAWEK